jgi:hypothetical protein
MLRTVTILALALAVPAAAGDTTRIEDAGMRYAVPRAWTRVPAPSDVRAAQYTIPRAPGDGEDGELILFFFGPGKGGGTDENLTRWYAQFTQPDGKASRDAAVLTIRTIKQLRVTAVDLAGTYVGGQMPGSAPSAPKPGYRMLAAIIEGDGGPWFFKALGPAATIAKANPDFDHLIDSLEPHH